MPRGARGARAPERRARGDRAHARGAGRSASVGATAHAARRSCDAHRVARSRGARPARPRAWLRPTDAARCVARRRRGAPGARAARDERCPCGHRHRGRRGSRAPAPPRGDRVPRVRLRGTTLPADQDRGAHARRSASTTRGRPRDRLGRARRRRGGLARVPRRSRSRRGPHRRGYAAVLPEPPLLPRARRASRSRRHDRVGSRRPPRPDAGRARVGRGRRPCAAARVDGGGASAAR